MDYKDLKKSFYLRFYALICKLNLPRFCKIENDERDTSPHKLVFFCGTTGIEYLNASLVSVYRNWYTLPEVIIITDGTPANVIQKKLIKWPRKLEILTWEFCGSSLNKNGGQNLYNYATKDVWGKKLVGICYCAEKYTILYSDTDILWFSSPVLEDIKDKTIVKMCQDVDHHYSISLIDALNQNSIFKQVPLNAGLIYAAGDFSKFPQWGELCKYLALYPDHRTEQTSFAILNNYFNPGDYFAKNEIFIQVDDMYSFKYTRKKNPLIWARHYVNLKSTSFWRDFIIMTMKKSIINLSKK